MLLSNRQDNAGVKHVEKATEVSNMKYFLPVFVIVIFTLTFAVYLYFRTVTEETIRGTLLEQFKQRQIDKTASLSKSIAADLDLLMTKLQVLSESGPVQRGDFAGEETNLLMERIYNESNGITRVEGIGISNSNNIVMNVFQPEINKNDLIGLNMSSRPFAVEARSNYPNPTFSTGYETIVNNEGQRVALLYPIIDNQGMHLGWTRSAIDASFFFERYGNTRDIESEYYSVIDKKGNILVSPLNWLEGKNVVDEEVQKESAYDRMIDEHLQKVLSGEPSNTVTSESISTAYPITLRGEPVYFVFLVTPSSLIYSEIEDTLFAQKIQTIVLLCVSATAISILVILLTRMNLILRRTVRVRTNELESASLQLQSLNEDLQIKNEQLVNSNAVLAKKENALQNAMIGLLQADKEKREFSAMITHELKTPLVPIIGYSHMFLKGKLGETSPVQRRKLEVMYKNAERLVALIQDILDAQKLELGQMHFQFTQSSANHVIEESINSLRSQADANGISLHSRLDRELDLICDPERIIQVLNNLISNSLKFTPDNGDIVISALLRDDSIEFSVKDNGTGIPKEKQNRLFTKFYQVDTSLTRKSGGTGLGLVICKGIVEAHNGKIWFESEPGKGSIFSFSIPVSRSHGQ
jgi:signal transduction histidine kinase